MRRLLRQGGWAALLLWTGLVPACDDEQGSSLRTSPDAGMTADASAATSCAMPLAVDDAGMDVRACHVGRAYAECGNYCGCLSDDPATCAVCGEARTCTNRCKAHEYAAACGGSPVPGGPLYADPPATCRSVLIFPSGTQIFCCPCS
jgi:hypothetical protein